jgi:hypothetical protein
VHFLKAALVVLADSDRPLTGGEVLDRAILLGLVKSTGKTPVASLSAALYVEAKSNGSRVRKLSTPGLRRAARGSVKWTLADR